jgi:hypothetical protein
MVEWLLTNLFPSGSLTEYLIQFQQVISVIIGNQFILWTVVVLFILLLRWLIQPRSNML